MKVILATWRALCLVGNISVCAAVFLIWSAIAAGSGWVLVHLPDVWYVHLENESSTSFAVAAITSYAVVAGALFLAFSCGALRMLADAYTEILRFAGKRCSQRAVSAIQRRRNAFYGRRVLIIGRWKRAPATVTASKEEQHAHTGR
jgi:FlaA1/EpsC-like NDP-sugar epimerase